MNEGAAQPDGFQWGRSGVIEVLATVAFVWTTDTVIGGEALPTSYGVGLILALVPAFIWLTFVYRQDRVNPEPPSLVITTFVLGGLLAWGIGNPLAEYLFSLSEWRYSSPTSKWIGAIAILGTLHQLCAYLAVRFAVFQTGDLDEPVDGIIYAAAGCLGVATATTVYFVVAQKGLMPLAGTAWISSVVLIHVAAALPLGLGIARRRMGGSSFGLGIFFVISVILNGGLTEGLAMVGSEGGQFKPWHLVIIASTLAAFVLIIGGIITDRLRLRSVEVDHDVLARPMGSSPAVDLAVWLLAAGLIGGGLAYAKQQVPQSKTITGLEDKVTITLPNGWTSHKTETGLSIEETGLSNHVATIHITPISKSKLRSKNDTSTTQTSDLILFGMEQDRRKIGTGYRTLRVEERSAFGSHKTMWSHFAYLAENDNTHGELMPTLLRGVDVVVSSAGSPSYTVRATWPAGAKDDAILNLIQSVRFAR